MEYKPIYLVLVDENNKGSDSNKYYNMIPNGDTFVVKYGRIGVSEQTQTYPISKWSQKLKEKIKKGYTEISDLMLDVINDTLEKTEDDNPKDKFSSISIESIREVIKRLYNYANKVVTSSYRVSSSVVTQDQIDTAQKQIDFISSNYKSWDLKEFNAQLKSLFKILPRKMKTVKQFLAEDMSEETIQKIIMREQDTLDSLAGMVYIPKSQQKYEGIKEAKEQKDEEIKEVNILQEMGIEMEETSSDEDEMLKKLMGDSSNKFYKAWKVCNQEAEEKYKKFIQKNNITKTKLLCHGSRNANWFNILKLSLMIRPSNAIYTGSLLGDALYMSNPENYNGGVIKSIRYSSLDGYWSGEHQNCGFIAFFEVATGDSYDIYNFDSRFHTYTLEKLQKDCPGAWSLHLHGVGHGGSSTVINDEITVYNKEQVSIRYLVEIR